MFSHFFNIGNLYKVFYENNFFRLTNKKINQKIFEDTNRNNNLHSFNDVNQNLMNIDENELQDRIKQNYEFFIANNSFDSNKEQIEFEIKFIYKNEIILGKYIVNKNGLIEYFFKKKNKEVFKNTINFFNLNSFSNHKLTYENWELNLLWVHFDPKFDFGILIH